MTPATADAIIATGNDMERLVRVYIKIRDARAVKKKAFEFEDTRLVEQQETLKTELLKHMLANNVDTIGTESGTVYKSEEIKASCEDWQLFYDFVKKHDAFDLLEKRIARNAVKAYMENNGGRLPPAVSIFKEVDVKIRRK
jgi:hypothetical protein